MSTTEAELKDVIRVQWGLITCRLCARRAVTPDEAADWATMEDPPGTMANRWVVSDDQDLDNLEPCNEFPDERYHLLVNC